MKYIGPCLITIFLEIIFLISVELLINKKVHIKMISISVPMNALTNPLLNLGLFQVQHDLAKYLFVLIIGEILVVLVESYGYYLINHRIKKSLMISLGANLFSFTIGMIIMNLRNVL